MKKLAILFGISALLLVTFYYLQNLFPSQPQNSFYSPSSPTIVDTSHQLNLNNQEYQYYFYKIPSSAKLSLIPNFTQKESAKNIVRDNCDFAINGGLYTKNETPVGLFFQDNQLLAKQITHQTFNGLLTKDKDSNLNILISTDFDNNFEKYDFIVQSGPFYNFFSNTKEEYVNHQFDRRHLIAKDVQDNFYLFSISSSNNAYSGPRLEDIPDFFSHPQIKQIASFSSALNLDGGSASAFYDGVYLVDELSPVGSILCGKLL
ncbi:phosphodiester glycosidase family protein [Patescibacteria group bacterium]|nr:phosphodiester glycosidase family protein [Patescibacteria group bacterium]